MTFPAILIESPRHVSRSRRNFVTTLRSGSVTSLVDVRMYSDACLGRYLSK